MAENYDLSTNAVTETHMFEHSIILQQAHYWYCQNNGADEIAIGLDVISMNALRTRQFAVSTGASILAAGNTALSGHMICPDGSLAQPTTATTLLGLKQFGGGFRGALVSYIIAATDALLTANGMATKK